MNDELVQKLRVIEGRIDRMLVQFPLPSPDHAFSKWAILTTADDMQRVHFRPSPEALPVIDALRFIDDAKYALKYTLQSLHERLPYRSLGRPPADLGRRAYTRSARLLQFGVKYRAAVAGFGTFFGGTATAHFDSDKRLVFRPKDDPRYGVLDELCRAFGDDADEVAPIVPLFSWLVAEDPRGLPPPVTAIADQTFMRRRGQIGYRVDTGILQELDDILPTGRSPIPHNWESRYGSGRQLRSYFRTLFLLGVYHELAIDLGASRFALEGHGLGSLVPVVTTSALARRLASLSGLSENYAGQLTNLLVYGARVKSPDPALQPLVPATRAKVFVPWMTIVGSALERNFLTLLARADTAEFDRASGVFERAMIERVLGAVSNRAWRTAPNRWLRSGSQEEEVDVLLSDPESRAILLLELRWTLAPGETREIVTREHEAEKKLSQIRRKIEFARENLEALGAIAETSVDSSWTIAGAVVTEGFLPTIAPSEGSEPILPLKLLAAGVGRFERLSDLCGWLDGREWLPREGEHFHLAYEETRFAQDVILTGAVGTLPAGFDFVADLLGGGTD